MTATMLLWTLAALAGGVVLLLCLLALLIGPMLDEQERGKP